MTSVSWVPNRTWSSLVLPSLLFVLVFYALPVCNLIWISFAEHSLQEGVVPGFSLDNYIDLAHDAFYFDVLWRTIRLSLATTLCCAVLGYPVAVYLTRVTGWRQTIMFIVLLMPLVTSVTVMSYGWLILLGRNGVINTLLVGLGLFDRPRQIMFNETVIVVGLVHVLVVFMVISVAASLQSIDPALVRAARSLGARPFTAFRVITLPLSIPGLRTGALLVFVLSMSAYATPTVLGGSRIKFLSYLVYQQAISLNNWPRGAAMAVILLIATTAILALASAIGQFRAMRRQSVTRTVETVAPAAVVRD